MKPIIVLITAPSKKEAGRISKIILNEKLAACVNVIAPVYSTYWWKGKIESAKEQYLIFKTTSEILNKLVKRVKELHSYSVPEIIALPIIGGNKDYLNWIKLSTSSRKTKIKK